MSRMLRDPYYSVPAHPKQQDALSDVVRRLTAALENGGKPDASTTQDCIAELSSARRTLEQCTEYPKVWHVEASIHDIAEFKISKHSDLILWITDVSLALKLQDVQLGEWHKQLSLDLLERGNPLIAALDDCRIQARWA